MREREGEREREREIRLLHKAHSISQPICLSHDVNMSAYMSFHEALLAPLLTRHRHEKFQLYDPEKQKQNKKQQHRTVKNNTGTNMKISVKDICLRCRFYFDKNNIA